MCMQMLFIQYHLMTTKTLEESDRERGERCFNQSQSDRQIGSQKYNNFNIVKPFYLEQTTIHGLWQKLFGQLQHRPIAQCSKLTTLQIQTPPFIFVMFIIATYVFSFIFYINILLATFFHTKLTTFQIQTPSFIFVMFIIANLCFLIHVLH